MRVLSVLDCFLIQLRADGRSPYWRDQIDRHIHFLDGWLAEQRLPRDVRRITHEHVAGFLASPQANTRRDGQPKRATSTNCLRSSVRVFFAYAHVSGHAPRNAAALVRRARCACPPPRALPEADCRRLLATLASAKGPIARRDELLFRLMLRTGIRLGSALALEADDVDLSASVLVLRRMKGDRPAQASIPPAMRQYLRQCLAKRQHGPLFSGPNGQALSTRHARRRLAIWLKRAGARHAGPHALRHSFATQLYARARDIVVVQRALGHASPATSLVYAASCVPVSPSTASAAPLRSRAIKRFQAGRRLRPRRS